MTDPDKDPVEGDPTDSREDQPGAELDQSKLRTDGGVAISKNSEGLNPLNGPSGSISPSIEETESSASDLEQLERTVLEPPQELCGRLEGIHRTDTQLVVVVSSGVLKFPLDSSDDRICEQELMGNIGDRVSILRSPQADQSLLICVHERPQ